MVDRLHVKRIDSTGFVYVVTVDFLPSQSINIKSLIILKDKKVGDV
jgi:hypothetical protein